MPFTYINNANPAYIDDLYHQYQSDPKSVDSDWQRFFEGYDFSKLPEKSPDNTGQNTGDVIQIKAMQLVDRYRTHGHLLAPVNPIVARDQSNAALLTVASVGLTDADKTATVTWQSQTMSLDSLITRLQETYCTKIAAEFMYCKSDVAQFITENLDNNLSKFNPKANKFDSDHAKKILDQVADAVLFESFLHTKYVGQKRFSLEGCEALIPGLHAMIASLATAGATRIVMGMAHRGRLNVLAHIIGKPYERIFREFDGAKPESSIPGDGDVKYHLGYSSLYNDQTKVSLLPNPSHLEAVNGVVQGAVYAKRRSQPDAGFKEIVPILIHGDAALSGQGVNYEVTNMSHLPGYANGGTLHVVVNNQLGYTTTALEGRSSIYCTDIAKVTGAPVFHVSADDPQSVVAVMTLASQIRNQFNTDVYVDIIGYRRYGHNEGDEPRFTQPKLYEQLKNHENVYEKFASELQQAGIVTASYCDTLVNQKKTGLTQALERARLATEPLPIDTLASTWSDYRAPRDSDFSAIADATMKTGINADQLDAIAIALTQLPTDLPVITKIQKIVSNRKKLYSQNQVDWALAEQLAYGSIVYEGAPVRLSGQDAQRGTFSHRHAVLHSRDSTHQYIPLNHIKDNQGDFSVYNSLLSEYCVLAFEVGVSWSTPQGLTIWEAQFGDFCNGAQIVIDQFIASAASKWYRFSGLVLLLPHGYEGMGPEHSSARFERFLQLCAGNNMYVTNITTPANLFHALRRQYVAPFRLPLVIMSPKSLLRHPDVMSTKDALINGHFQTVIDDDAVDPSAVKRVVFCSGKLFYDLKAYRDEHKAPVALVRIEQLYPFPTQAIATILEKYTADYIWAQEEPANMGPWSSIVQWFPGNLRCVSRPASASPAVGNAGVHAQEQAAIIQAAITH